MESLEKYFDIAFAAPNGIQKLRELILTLAMQGKLVPQDPDDQPASELLKEIEAEKQRLVKEGKIKLSKPLPEIKLEKIPYELPKGWQWVCFDHIAENSNNALKAGPFGSALKKSMYTTSGYKIYGQEQVISGDENFGDYFIDEEKYRSLESCAVKPGDILISLVGTIGKVLVLSKLCQPGIINPRLVKISLYVDIHREFITHLLGSPLIQIELSERSHGGTMNILNLGILRDLLLPLPPLAEQHRIVAKIDQLMARCDGLEKLRNERNQKRITIHTAALNRLLAAQNTRDFQTSWRFITQHFSELYTVKENVTELRKAILQLAVMGKLVPQDPTDPPARELLKEITAEKQRLIKEGKIKPQKPLPEIQPEEVPFELPKGWELARFEDIVEISSGVTKGRRLEGRETVTLPYLRVANVQRGYLDLEVIKDIEIPIDEIPKFELKARDLLITEGGDWDKVGRTAIWGAEITHCIHQNHVFKARLLLDKQDEQWLERYLNSSVARAYFADAAKQTTNLASINKTQLRGCPIPLPPLPEQHRIVAKVDQLMTLCDQLEQQIDAATSKQTALLNAVMAELPPTSPTSGGL